MKEKRRRRRKEKEKQKEKEEDFMKYMMIQSHIEKTKDEKEAFYTSARICVCIDDENRMHILMRLYLSVL
jgi:hypothetical protein